MGEAVQYVVFVPWDIKVPQMKVDITWSNLLSEQVEFSLLDNSIHAFIFKSLVNIHNILKITCMAFFLLFNNW